MVAQRKYPLELQERAVAMCRAAEPKPVIRQMVRQLGVHPEALRGWIRKDEECRRQRPGRSGVRAVPVKVMFFPALLDNAQARELRSQLLGTVAGPSATRSTSPDRRRRTCRRPHDRPRPTPHQERGGTARGRPDRSRSGTPPGHARADSGEAVSMPAGQRRSSRYRRRS
jgi:transposase-like protein